MITGEKQPVLPAVSCSLQTRQHVNRRNVNTKSVARIGTVRHLPNHTSGRAPRHGSQNGPDALVITYGEKA